MNALSKMLGSSASNPRGLVSDQPAEIDEVLLISGAFFELRLQDLDWYGGFRRQSNNDSGAYSTREKRVTPYKG